MSDMNYIDRIAVDIGVRCGVKGVDADESGMRLLRIYAVLALTVGERVTWENVHDAWSAWRADAMPRHKSLIPFAELAPDVQALDAKYAEAIQDVARTLSSAFASHVYLCSVHDGYCQICKQEPGHPMHEVGP